VLSVGTSALLLLLTAFAAGVTGAWSPCGFSMVETLGSARIHAGARAVRASCATFALGALAGGAITFTALSGLGAVLGGAGSTAALAAAVAIALAAALGEALGIRVVPQIRRQVPEPWRRTLPLPLAAGLYGVLLGLGFTTFVLTLAVWALAGIAVAIGSLEAGLLIGVGFGAGRALPVVLMAPRYATLGLRLEQAMAERPVLLRRLRLADGALLTLLAVAFLASGSASAAAPATGTARHDPTERATSAARTTLVAPGATDPSRTGAVLAYERLGGAGAVIVDGDARSELPAAQNVAIGGRHVATREGERIVVRDRGSGDVVVEQPAPRATQLAVSDRWLVWRSARRGGGDRLWALPLPVARALPAEGAGRAAASAAVRAGGEAAPGTTARLVAGEAALAPGARLVAGVRKRKSLGRPALDGDRLAYAVATRRESRIVVERLAAGTRRVLLRARHAELSQPALDGGRVLFVQSSSCSQRLRLTRLGDPGSIRTLLRLGTTAHRDEGHEHDFSAQGSEPSHCPRGPRRTDTVLWTTALAGPDAYVTLLRPAALGGGAPVAAQIVRVGA
jgi:hypothetical protein